MEKINKFIQQIKENKWIHYLILLIIGIILSIPLYKIQLRVSHDGSLHLLRVLGTYNTLKIGQFPPLIAPFFCNNWGYSMNLFYNPIVTYIPLLIKLFIPTYTIALKVFAGLCIILSGITMYQFVYNVTEKRAIALFAGIIYLIVPYKLGDVYIRFAIGEFASFVFLPILFLGIYNLFNQDGKKHYYIAIGAIGLLLTHTITTFYTAIICLIYVLFNIKKLKEKEVIKKLLINVVFILLISAFFIMPMMEAKTSANYAIFDNEIMVTNGDFVYSNTLELSEFFKDTGELIGNKKSATYVIGIPIFVFMCLTIFTYKKVDKKYKDFYIISWVFIFISLFMSTKYCPWFIFPDILCKLQYPWRMLTFFAFFVPFVVGVNFYILMKTLLDKDISRLIIITILIILMVIYTIPILLQYEEKDTTLDVKYEENVVNNPELNYMSINREYMPVKALVLQRTYLKEREDKTYILQGEANIINEEKDNLTDIIKVQNIEEGTILEFPYLYYPGYKITLEKGGEKVELKSVESENGFVSCIIDKNIDETTINVKYVGTTITYVSYVVSFISLIIFVAYIIKQKRRLENKQ